MSKKSIFGLIAGLLVTAGGISAFFPGAGPAVGVALSGVGRELQRVVGAMPDDCAPSVCAGGAIHGPVGFPDGGPTCSCP
jgi:hypothetical protein